MKIPLREQGTIDAGGDDRPREYTPAPHNSVFEAEVLEVKVEDSPWTDDQTGEKKQQMSFKFKVVEPGDFEGRWFWGRTSTWFSEDARSKLRQFVQAILDEDVLPSGFVLDTDNLEGQRCRIIVHAKEKADGSGRMVNWVQEVRPTRNTYFEKKETTLRSGRRPLDDVPDDELEPF